jgi:hypothetical protein
VYRSILIDGVHTFHHCETLRYIQICFLKYHYVPIQDINTVLDTGKLKITIDTVSMPKALTLSVVGRKEEIFKIQCDNYIGVHFCCYMSHVIWKFRVLCFVLCLRL